MFGETLAQIGSLMGLRRSPTQAAAERLAAEIDRTSEADLVTKAAEAFEAGDRARAAALLSAGAERGDVEARYRLGEMLYNGHVPTQTYPNGEASYPMQRAAIRWLSAAAEAGHSGAQARLGLIYLVDPDPNVREKGRQLLAGAAAAGDPLALQHAAKLAPRGGASA